MILLLYIKCFIVGEMLSRKDMAILIFDNTKSMSRQLSLPTQVTATADTATDTAYRENKTSPLSSLTLLDGAKQVAENL